MPKKNTRKKALKKKSPKKVKKSAKKRVKKAPKKKAKKAVKRKGKVKAAKKSAKKVKMPPSLGQVTHYYDRIGVGILKLKGPLGVGERILLKRGKQEFTQIVDSLQIEHENISKAKKGDEIGLKLKEKIKEGALVYKA